MKTTRLSRTALGALRAGVLLAAVLVAGWADAQSVVPALGAPGPYPVACSNIEQDFTGIANGLAPEAYWRGLTDRGSERYVTSLLRDREHAHAYVVAAPADGDLFARWAGRTLEYVALTCYPTTAENRRPDYVLPGGATIPRMQRGAEPPLLPATPSRFPVLLYSHGYGGSPVSDSYLDALTVFASWGFVTIAPFHGDLRYTPASPVGNPAGPWTIPVWDEFVAMQATRPLSMSAALDRVARDPQWMGRLDLARVGAFGVSQGGETIMLMGGARLNYSLLTQDVKQVTFDRRVRAGVGYVPYFGLKAVPAFGSGQEGIAGVRLPFLALSGTADPIAPIGPAQQALERAEGPRALVALVGEGHELWPEATGDIYTWALTFYAAWLLDDASAHNRLHAMQSVAGGLDDRKRFYDGGPAPVPGQVVDAIEFHHAGLDHYFITAFADEAAALDAGTAVRGWKRTGYSFRTWQAGTGPGNDACRFFGTPGVGPNSHFYTIDARECALVRGNPAWTFEAMAFRAVEPVAGTCAPGSVAVTRLYNDGMGGAANHRYLVDADEVRRMIAKGWRAEGAVICTPP